MKPNRITYTTTGTKAWIPVDRNKTPFALSAYTENGTVTSLEFTVDDLQDASITPVAAGTLIAGAFTTPCTGIRVTVATAPLTLKILQAG